MVEQSDSSIQTKELLFKKNGFQSASKIMRHEESHQVYLTDRPKIQVTPENASVTDSSHMSFASQMFSAATLNSCTIQIMSGNVSIRHDQRMESGSSDLNIVLKHGIISNFML